MDTKNTAPCGESGITLYYLNDLRHLLVEDLLVEDDLGPSGCISGITLRNDQAPAELWAPLAGLSRLTLSHLGGWQDFLHICPLASLFSFFQFFLFPLELELTMCILNTFSISNRDQASLF